MGEFHPLLPSGPTEPAESFSAYRPGEHHFIRHTLDGQTDPSSAQAASGSSSSSGPSAPIELPRPPIQDVSALLIEAEARGRALAHASLGAMRREVEAMKAALEQEKLVLHDLIDGVDLVEDQMKMEFRTWFGEVVLSATRRVLTTDTAREAIFRNRLSAVAEQLVLEKEVVLKVPPRFVSLARSLLADHPGWTVSEQPTLTAGCVAECRSGAVDGSLDAALAGLDGAVKEWLARGRESRPA